QLIESLSASNRDRSIVEKHRQPLSTIPPPHFLICAEDEPSRRRLRLVELSFPLPQRRRTPRHRDIHHRAHEPEEGGPDQRAGPARSYPHFGHLPRRWRRRCWCWSQSGQSQVRPTTNAAIAMTNTPSATEVLRSADLLGSVLRGESSATPSATTASNPTTSGWP